MNTIGLWAVTAIYAWQGSVWLRAGNWSDALILCGYVIANIGLIAKADAWHA